MSDQIITMLDDTDDPLVGDAEPAPAVGSASSFPAPSEGSILGRLRADQERQRRESSIVLPVGRSDVLAARYRALSDEEQAKIRRRIKSRAKVRKGDDESLAVETAALTLVLACVEVLWVGDGPAVPLVNALAKDGVDTEGEAPLRFDRRLARVIGLPLDEDASTVDVVIALHTWEDEDGNSNVLPLMSVTERYGAFLSGEAEDSLEETLEGI